MKKINGIYNVLERVCTLFRNETRLAGLKYGLQPVHLDILFYLSRCNKYSNTPAGVTEYIGITKGTMSQSITLLQSKKLLEKVQDQNDRRIIHLLLTKKGEGVTKKSTPPSSLKLALENYSAEQRNILQTELENILLSLQGGNNNSSFGLCNTCTFHRPISKTHFHCELTGEALETAW
ncbi:MarR family transcriptional regulator [Colwellia sp. MSW7]|uniref:MarR family transcriptional regulator n=1 Tax=Colwellia maritima TaxID=2912588 RepID=A0ABS9WYR9_9GAMM|nr:MarR family winged helix-turn-helix transcriptional regulator [Colwellia maritima]MCI2282356.1 MarR family transcriptional regulator [Colwellia maritima]